MPERVVVSNTSPVFYLHQIGRLSLLQALYRRLVIPPAVERELLAGGLAPVLSRSGPSECDSATR